MKSIAVLIVVALCLSCGVIPQGQNTPGGETTVKEEIIAALNCKEDKADELVFIFNSIGITSAEDIEVERDSDGSVFMYFTFEGGRYTVHMTRKFMLRSIKDPTGKYIYTVRL